MAHGSHVHLVDTKGKYHGARFVMDEDLTKLEESGWYLIPVGDAHLAAETVKSLVTTSQHIG